jgi:hypothetical protein
MIRQGYKRPLLALLALITTVISMSAIDLADEDLNYIITYKWGIINKDAGAATLSLRGNSNGYNARLTARTLPWADKVFMVRDTLRSTMRHSDYMPTSYRKTTHEGGRYRDDNIRFVHNGNEVTGYVTRASSKNGGTVNHSDTVLHAVGPTVDMLSVFYYLRTVDFGAMKSGTKLTLNIFSGFNVEQVHIVYQGTQTITANNKQWNTYCINFSFTTDGKVSSSGMTTWISADSSRIPVKVTGTLPFGKVHAYYTGSTTGK